MVKELLIINDTTTNRISYYHAAAFLIALPFDRFYSEILLISWLLHSLIHLERKSFYSAIDIRTLLVSAAFFITAAGLIFSNDTTQGLKDLQRQLALILLPIVFSISRINWSKYLMNLLLIFSYTCAGTILFLYADSLHIIAHNKLPLRVLFTQAFLNHNFSNTIDLHATYLSMYCLISVITLFYALTQPLSIRTRAIYLFALLVLLSGLVQLASRSVFISAIVIAFAYPFFIAKGVRRIAFIAVAAVAGIFLTLIITSNNSLRARYLGQLKEDLVQTSINNEMSEPRITRWKLALQLANESPIYGHGSGAEKRLMNDAYFNNRFYNSYLHELNTHNQYLGIALEAGAVGLSLFISSLIVIFLMAFYRRDILLGGCWAIVCIVSLSENILNVNKGIFFYAFFFSLFLYSGKPSWRISRLKSRPEKQNDRNNVNQHAHAAAVSSDHYV